MSTVRKFKLKSNKGKTVVRSRPIAIGETQDNEVIFVHAETKSFLDNNYNKALSELYENIKLPKKAKLLSQYTKEEKALIESVDGIDKNKLITVYDETNPEFASKKAEIEALKQVLILCSFFNMDATVETEDGKEITHWEDWGLSPKVGLLGLAKFLVDKETGLGLSEIEIGYIAEEIERLKSGKKTLGEMILEKMQPIEELKEVTKAVEAVAKEDGTV